MKKLAIIGASYLQLPLILKAKEMGLETHVFAWAKQDVGQDAADFFYPISIVDKELVLQRCQEIGIDGICSIGSDLAVVTVNFVADKMGLAGNSLESTELTTNKHNMRLAFEQNGDPSPKSVLVRSLDDVDDTIEYPVIIKPLDRSGSRGIYKVDNKEKLGFAIEQAKEQGFIKEALIEEYVDGSEYSIECISYMGEHHLLAVTLKYTTGAPHFIETGHLEPAPISDEIEGKIRHIVFHALDSLKITNGASHSEVKIGNNGKITIIEIGARMGGDLIGSSLVRYSTGIDFLKAVIDISMGKKPQLDRIEESDAAGIHFICSEDDMVVYKKLRHEHPEYIVEEDIPSVLKGEISDSSTRLGYFVMKASSVDQLLEYMPGIED